MERVREIQWLRRRSDPKIMIRDLIAWNHHDLADSIGRIACPTLIVRGEDDPGVSQEMAERTCRAIPGAEWMTLPGVGQFPMAESQGFHEMVAGFLKRHHFWQGG